MPDRPRGDEPMFASGDGLSIPAAVPPLATVVIVFPKRR
jgi:hypothetical protein